MGLIEIENMEFYAFHGCYKEEKIVGNKFTVNVSIIADCDKAAETDDINHTVNYQKVYTMIKKEFEKKSNLLENVAGRILDSLYANFAGIERATVKVSKHNPPMGGKIDKVSVTLTK